MAQVAEQAKVETLKTVVVSDIKLDLEKVSIGGYSTYYVSEKTLYLGKWRERQNDPFEEESEARQGFADKVEWFTEFFDK